MIKKIRYLFLLLTIVSMLMTGSGCDYVTFLGIGLTKIREISDSPIKFDGKEVRIKGVVGSPFRIPFTERVVYTVKDDSGEITVVGLGALPKANDAIKVKGIVSTPLKIGSETIGTHINETKRW